MIRTIIFDLGKVIVPFDFHRGYVKMAALAGCAPEDIPARLREHDLVQRFESGEIEPQAFVEQLSKIAGFSCTFEEFSAIWSSIFLSETLLSDQFLEALHKQYRLVLLSNTNAIHFEMILRTYPLLRHFDQLVLSYKVGAMKPSPKIFQAAIEAAWCKPEECFFTDDIPAYVAGAREYGIDAVQFENAAQIERELKIRGVEW
ncbi:MAG: HAD family phosphatase [Bryobacteraceae bacterium]|nr:HAD family phosphatase [Bryobacteraceae bacterium]